jgi:hypothetical protein
MIDFGAVLTSRVSHLLSRLDASDVEAAADELLQVRVDLARANPGLAPPVRGIPTNPPAILPSP